MNKKILGLRPKLNAKITLYSANLKESSKVELPAEYSSEINKSLITQANYIYQDRSHAGNSKAKTRAEVNITKKKIYKQKGTGGARHGASSAPIFVGGGVTHGPKGIKRILTLPKQMRIRALTSIMSLRAQEGKVVTVEGLGDLKKTKDAAVIINKISQEMGDKKVYSMLFVLADDAKEAKRSIRNIQNISAIAKKDLNVFAVLNHNVIVLDSKFVEIKNPTKAKPKTKTK